MAITEQQRIERKGYIGGSDCPAVLGVSPYRNAYDVWLEKTGRLPEVVTTSEAIELGNMMEAPLVDWAAKKMHIQVIQSPATIVMPCRFIAANLDAQVVGEPEAIEAKSTGLTGGPASPNWGDEGTDQVPDHVLMQAHHQMLVSGFQIVWVPALIGGRGRVLYRIDRNADICEILEQRLTEFWSNHVLADTPPENLSPCIENLKIRRRVEGISVPVPDDLVEAWANAKDLKTRAEKAVERAQADLLAALGDAEAGESKLGRITYFEQKRKGYTVADAAFRVLRIK